MTLIPKDGDQWSRAVCAKGGCFIPDQPVGIQAYLAAQLPDILPGCWVIVTDGPKAQDDFYHDLCAFRMDADVAFYPSWEHLPGQGHSRMDDVLGDRLKVLQRCRSGTSPVLIVTCVQALMQKTLAPDELEKGLITLETGASLNWETLLSRVMELGYEPVPEVAQKGDCAHRGGLLDIWPPASDWPFRVEFFGDQVDSIRTFNPVDQRSIDRLDRADIAHAHERGSAGEEGQAGLTATLLDYLPAQTGWVWSEWDRVQWHAKQYEEAMSLADAKEWIVSFRALRSRQAHRAEAGQVFVGGAMPKGALVWPCPLEPVAGLPGLDGEGLKTDLLEHNRRAYVREWIAARDQGFTVRVFFATEGARERFVEWCGAECDPSALFELVTAPLSEGFRYADGQLLIVSEHDLYGRRKETRGRYDPHARRAGPQKMEGERVSGWRDIQPGELVVHIEHGIGRYLGLFEIETDGKRQEVLSVEYADEARLYLPVGQSHLLSRYVGMGRARPELHALGGGRWMREKIAAERAVRDLAALLLETQAARQTQAGHAYSADTPWQHEFESSFPFQETEDQLRAIQAVKNDMENARPMDRLICGDVGYGKTEVAMRAAFKAVMDGKQVAMLVPTTVLAQQHYQTFVERMAAFPVRIEMLSRFRTKGQQRDIVHALNEGAVDIVIGTHRLVQPDVRFQRLGLVIIDEEQRFGVEHKEHLKHLRQLVDVLTMTATPIPRTLYMSMTGARDISTIQTAPRERLPVETIVSEFKEDLVRDAIRRELNRGGQVFYLHNRVQTIEMTAKTLQRLVPEARIAIGHGQLNEHELEQVMTAFVRGDYDVLLCTTIIESGVDIPNVNTIIIERADRFGLSGLYQLRGRVGRYKHQAYAYLLLPRHGQLYSAARKRVQAIRKYTGLGSGFKLAMRDLEIRGAGNILGAQQSGHIAAVGFDLYCQFLQRTIARMKGEEPPPVADAEVRLDFVDTSPSNDVSDHTAMIPTHYIEDETMRVNLYRRIAGLAALVEVDQFADECRDRFGAIPAALERLLLIARIRILASQQRISSLDVRDNKVMMRRNQEWIMPDKRYPRLQAETAHEKLRELMDVLNRIQPA